MPTTLPPRRRRRFPWKLILCGLLGLTLGAALAGWRAIKFEPQFYREALAGSPDQRATASKHLEDEVQVLHDRVQTDETWDLELSEDELNAWLAVELPRRYAQQMPKDLQEPRVSIDAQRIRLAGQYRSGSVDTIVSLELVVSLAAEPNTLAIQIRRARAGAVPLPPSRLMEEATRAAGRSELPLRVETVNDQPRFLLTVPSQSNAWPDRRLHLEQVELEAGKIKLSGRSEPL